MSWETQRTERVGGGGRETTERRGRERKPRAVYSHTEEGVAEKIPRTERSDSEMDTEGKGEVGTSQLQSSHKKGHIMNNFKRKKQKTNTEVIVVTDKVHFIPNIYGVEPYTVVMLYTTVFR